VQVKGGFLMATVSEHYDQFLGPVYSWMVGDAAAAMESNRAELQALGLRPAASGLAVDLGAGPGLHAIPLAQLGYTVLAVEGCAALAGELRARVGTLPVRIVEGDLFRFREHCKEPVDAILCMGDTLSHLASHEDVERLLTDVAAALAPSGVFVASFRDYFSTELVGPSRFIPVRSDETRILTCFLEYRTATVTVHDLLHERTEGRWQLRVGSYVKLRLAPQWVILQLEATGLAVQRDTVPGGMVRIVARRV
jgi:SAM-dependent methyltransferase